MKTASPPTTLLSGRRRAPSARTFRSAWRRARASWRVWASGSVPRSIRPRSSRSWPIPEFPSPRRRSSPSSASSAARRPASVHRLRSARRSTGRASSPRCAAVATICRRARLQIAPAIADVLDALSGAEGARLARMSGSGATCFALYDDRRLAARAARAVRARASGLVGAGDHPALSGTPGKREPVSPCESRFLEAPRFGPRWPSPRSCPLCGAQARPYKTASPPCEPQACVSSPPPTIRSRWGRSSPPLARSTA